MATATLPAPPERHRLSTSSEPDPSTMTPESKRRSGEAGISKSGSRRHDKEKKIGHRRVDPTTGRVTYKKKPTSELMATMQLGISHSLGSLASKPHRDLLIQDFEIVEFTVHPREGSNLTPAHHYSDFRFKTYAPIAFRYFRELFGIQPDDFLLSMCNEPMTELSNPGASGSIFYITDDDEFIVKTVQHSEADFLQKLLPGYYMNLNQNPRTLLPKFYGLFCYQCGGKNIRFIVMNNLLPSTIKMHEKYDLKGSTYKRRASKHERQKKTPTHKDLDFMELHPEGILLEADTYQALIKTIERDCRVLQSFKIMDYSLLIGVHNLDIAAREREQAELSEDGAERPPGSATPDVATSSRNNDLNRSISRGRSMKQRVAQYSTAMEAIQAHAEPLELDNEDIPPGGIPARNSKGERLLLYLGIIDVLQNYRLRKKLEHAMKSMVHDGDAISVHRPGFYAQRFQHFFAEKIFRKIPSLDQPQVKGPHMRFKKLVQLVVAANAMKHSPTKKKSAARPRSVTTTEIETRTAQVHVSAPAHERTYSEGDPGAVGGRPDLLPAATPPPTFSEALSQRAAEERNNQQPYANKLGVIRSPHVNMDPSADRSVGGLSPAHSVTDSAPTLTEYTEGTPSYTASSPSCSSDVLDARSVPSTTESTRKDYSSSSNTRLDNAHNSTISSSRNSSNARIFEHSTEESFLENSTSEQQGSAAVENSTLEISTEQHTSRTVTHEQVELQFSTITQQQSERINGSQSEQRTIEQSSELSQRDSSSVIVSPSEGTAPQKQSNSEELEESQPTANDVEFETTYL